MRNSEKTTNNACNPTAASRRVSRVLHAAFRSAHGRGEPETNLRSGIETRLCTCDCDGSTGQEGPGKVVLFRCRRQQAYAALFDEGVISLTWDAFLLQQGCFDPN